MRLLLACLLCVCCACGSPTRFASVRSLPLIEDAFYQATIQAAERARLERGPEPAHTQGQQQGELTLHQVTLYWSAESEYLRTEVRLQVQRSAAWDKELEVEALNIDADGERHRDRKLEEFIALQMLQQLSR